VDVFVRLYWKNMYEVIRCWAAIGDRADYANIYAKQLAEYETVCNDANLIAGAYRTVGLLLYFDTKCREAEAFFEKAAEIYNEINDELKLSLTLNDLGECCRNVGSLEKAEEAYKQALEIRRRVLSDNHEDTAESINNYGHIFYFKGDNKKAKELYQEAFEIRQSLFPHCHPKIAEGYNNLGVVFGAQGDKEREVDCLKKAVQIMEQGGFIETWETALYCEHLANAVLKEDDYAEGETLLRKTLDIRKTIFGWHHFDTISSIFKLANVYISTGKLPEFHSILNPIPNEAISKNISPEQFIGLTISLLNVLAVKGHQQAAASFIRDMPARIAKIYGDNNLLPLSHSALRANFYAFSELHAESAAEFCRALEEVEKYYGVKHIETLKICNRCGWEYRLAGEIEKAANFYSRTIKIGRPLIDGDEISDKQLSKDISFLVAVAHNELAFHKHVPKKEWESAMEYYRKAIDYMKRTGNKIETANNELNLGVAKHRAGKVVDIEQVKSLVAILQGANDPRAEKGKEIIGDPEDD
jgi:tetratricopeptide (TPR) repeat protein